MKISQLRYFNIVSKTNLNLNSYDNQAKCGANTCIGTKKWTTLL